MDKIVEFANKLEFSESQKKEISESFEKNTNPSTKFFAVRSSSPEEDLEGASFAGGYKTVLGVTREHLFDSIIESFVSCLDIRVFAYKKYKGIYYI